ncbi:aldehyde dehydrogenase family protein [Phytoactinopolyspora halotolerans]|uniref:Aldehyde dehydrogenase family protein n=1 Tax=Phytoactinopolyspora halotolerans TaxID=1981512 RepID=A0A6L9SGV1_9ACTN|nr:aldehyde dehydrogenase family protein [Phytoactinopolyspora halotolerans]NEE03828.1 aldehyde dehydrogenase family protein [Phytoactinopolyspora halotolerans]
MRQQDLFIDGTWVPAPESRTIVDRWTGADIGRVAEAGAPEATRAVDAAAHAFTQPIPVSRRAEILRTVAGLVESRADVFAEMIRAETGKPISAARTEVARAVFTFRLSSEEATRLPGEAVPLDAVDAAAGTFAFTRSEPRGIVAAITPFNFPLNLVAHKVGPTLAAGCPVVLKPSDRAPMTAGLMVEAFVEAGLPAGWLNLVTGDAPAVVGAWQDDPRVEVVTFTGSSRVGWQLKAQSPRKEHVLELGSNAAMVVDAEADLERAVADAVTGGFANSGQACVSLQRVYVHADVAEEFVGRLAHAVADVPFGDPTDPGTVVGPLITDDDTKRVLAWVQDAQDRGARVVAGGTEMDGVVAPTVVVGAAADDRLVCDEVFGPVITVVEVATLDDAIAAVNASRYGLNTSIYTSNLGTAMRYAQQAQAGSVLVNMPPSFRADHMPYGGVKESGQGTEGVKYAVEGMVRQKLIVLKP